jgi:hypothetical protein
MKMARRAISLSDQLCVSCFRGVFLARVLEVAKTAAWCRRNRNQESLLSCLAFFWVPRKQHPHGTRCVKPRCTVWVAQAVTQFAASGSNADTVRGVFASSSHFATAQMNSAFTGLAWRPMFFLQKHPVSWSSRSNHSEPLARKTELESRASQLPGRSPRLVRVASSLSRGVFPPSVSVETGESVFGAFFLGVVERSHTLVRIPSPSNRTYTSTYQTRRVVVGIVHLHRSPPCCTHFPVAPYYLFVHQI